VACLQADVLLQKEKVYEVKRIKREGVPKLVGPIGPLKTLIWPDNRI